MPGLDPKTRNALLQPNKEMQNLTKRMATYQININKSEQTYANVCMGTEFDYIFDCRLNKMCNSKIW